MLTISTQELEQQVLTTFTVVSIFGEINTEMGVEI